MRLYISSPIEEKKPIELNSGQSHYLAHVMRQKSGASVLIFNGKDGEWRAELISTGKKGWSVHPHTLCRAQTPPPSLSVLTAPIKRQEFLIEKVTELGVGHITPVLTDHTIIRQVNKERWHAWAVEASEQSEQLSVPLIHSPLPLFTLLGEWPADRPLLWCQERHPQACETISLLRGEGVDLSHPALLVGPEGGFSPQEKEFLSTRSFVHPFSLGTSVLRSETAAIVAVAALRFHLF